TTAPHARSVRSPSELRGSQRYLQISCVSTGHFRRSHGPSPYDLNMTPQAASCSRLLARGGPQFRIGRGRFLLGGPELVARGREVGGDPLHLGGDPIERAGQAE